MSTSSTGPAAAERRLQEVARLELAEGDRTRRRDRQTRTPHPVSAATPEGRSTASTGTPGPRQPVEHRGQGLRQPRPAADPEDAVQHQRVRPRDQLELVERHQPATRRQQRPQTRRVRLAEAADRLDPDAAPGQPGTGEQGVPAVVARARPGSAPAPRRPGRTAAASPAALRPARRRPAASGRRRPPRVEDDLLELPDPRGGEGDHIYASQTTTAEAMPASWDRLTWMVPMPSSAARAATVPVSAKLGRPSASVMISASSQDSPAGAPERLGQGLLGREPRGLGGHRPLRLGRGEQPAAPARGGGPPTPRTGSRHRRRCRRRRS